jgi:hypothetical protein
MESRRNEFKKGINLDDGRRRRGDTAIQLRKTQKEEGLAKRRNLMLNNFMGDQKDDKIGENVTLDSSDKKNSYTLNDIPELMVNLKSEVVSQQITALRAFRRLLSTEKNPPVQQCIECGAVPMFVHFLQVL